MGNDEHGLKLGKNGPIFNAMPKNKSPQNFLCIVLPDIICPMRSLFHNSVYSSISPKYIEISWLVSANDFYSTSEVRAI